MGLHTNAISEQESSDILIVVLLIELISMNIEVSGVGFYVINSVYCNMCPPHKSNREDLGVAYSLIKPLF